MKIQNTIALSTAALALSASLLTVPAFAVEGTLAEYPNCPHLQGHHDAECGYVEAQDEVPCSNELHQWLAPSSHLTAGCGWKPAVKGVPCAHVHTADCLPKNNVVDPDEDGDASAYIEPNYYADYDEDVTYVQDGYTVICRVLNVRATASTEKARIGILRRGETVKVLGFEGNWAKISYNGGEAYVYAKYIKKA